MLNARTARMLARKQQLSNVVFCLCWKSWQQTTTGIVVLFASDNLQQLHSLILVNANYSGITSMLFYRGHVIIPVKKKFSALLYKKTKVHISCVNSVFCCKCTCDFNAGGRAGGRAHPVVRGEAGTDTGCPILFPILLHH